MKKTLSLVAFGLLSLGFSFGQNASFEESYNKIVDGMTNIYPTLTNKQVLVNSGSLQTTIDLQANEFGYGTFKTDIAYITVSDIDKARGEVDLNFNSMVNGNIMGQDVNNIKIGVSAKVMALSNTVYVQIKDVSIDLQGLPVEFQSYGKEVQSQIEIIKNQWIKIPMPKEATDDLKNALNQGNSLKPQVIISLLKKYPIVYNAGYANNNYAVKLDGSNIMKLITTLNTKIGNDTTRMSLSEKRKIIALFNAISINGTLSDADKPILSFQTSIQQDNMIGTATMTMGNNKMNMKIDADIVDGEIPMTLGATISTEQTSKSSSNYDMNFYGKMYDNETTPSSMMFSIQGDNSRSVLNNYKINRPKKAKTMKQIEKMMSNESVKEEKTKTADEIRLETANQAEEERLIIANKISIIVEMYQRDNGGQYPIRKDFVAVSDLKEITGSYINNIPNISNYFYKSVEHNGKKAGGHIIATKIEASKANFFGELSDFDDKNYDESWEILYQGKDNTNQKPHGRYIKMSGL